MNKEAIAAAASGGTTLLGTVNSWWLWLTDPNSAHIVTALTVLLIISQLIWGWKKFFRGEAS